MNSLNLVKAGGDPKHFFDALAMSEREDRKASQNRKMIKMPSSSPELCWLAKELNWYWSRSCFRQHLVFQCCEPYYVIFKSKQRQRWASWSSCSGSRACHNSRLDWRRQRQSWRDTTSVTWYASDSTVTWYASDSTAWLHASVCHGPLDFEPIVQKKEWSELQWMQWWMPWMQTQFQWRFVETSHLCCDITSLQVFALFVNSISRFFGNPEPVRSVSTRYWPGTSTSMLHISTHRICGFFELWQLWLWPSKASFCLLDWQGSAMGSGIALLCVCDMAELGVTDSKDSWEPTIIRNQVNILGHAFLIKNSYRFAAE